jgi:outer membrane murein-binding lipoprotein Lpp
MSVHSDADEALAKEACIGTNNSTDLCWTGLYKPSSEALWQWSDGTATDYGFFGGTGASPSGANPWFPGEPNNYGGVEEDCVGLFTDEFLWNDIPCSELRYPLCLRDLTCDACAEISQVSSSVDELSSNTQALVSQVTQVQSNVDELSSNMDALSSNVDSSIAELRAMIENAHPIPPQLSLVNLSPVSGRYVGSTTTTQVIGIELEVYIIARPTDNEWRSIIECSVDNFYMLLALSRDYGLQFSESGANTNYAVVNGQTVAFSVCIDLPTTTITLNGVSVKSLTTSTTYDVGNNMLWYVADNRHPPASVVVKYLRIYETCDVGAAQSPVFEWSPQSPQSPPGIIGAPVRQPSEWWYNNVTGALLVAGNILFFSLTVCLCLRLRSRSGVVEINKDGAIYSAADKDVDVDAVDIEAN